MAEPPGQKYGFCLFPYREGAGIVDGEIDLKAMLNDGDLVGIGDNIVHVKGKVAAMLTAERVALNFLQECPGLLQLQKSSRGGLFP